MWSVCTSCMMFDMDLMVENRDVKHDHINHHQGVKIINVHMPANCLDCRLPSCGPCQQWPPQIHTDTAIHSDTFRWSQGSRQSQYTVSTRAVNDPSRSFTVLEYNWQTALWIYANQTANVVGYDLWDSFPISCQSTYHGVNACSA